MKIFISCDMEGVTGVADWGHVMPEGRDYERFRRILTDEVLLVTRQVKKCGADEIIVNEGHAGMSNLLIEKFDDYVKLIQGKLKPFGMMQGIDETFDGILLIGYHSRRGTKKGILQHTYASREVKINDVLVGEAGLNMYLGAHFGVPVILVSGDNVVCEEVKSLDERIFTVETKKGISNYSAVCLPPQKTFPALEEAVASAIEKIDSFEPIKLPKKLTLKIETVNTEEAEFASMIPGVERVSGYRIQFNSDDYVEIYQAFLIIQIIIRAVGFYARQGRPKV